MAVTGLIFAAFVLVHMIGNLKVYTGADHFDDYAHWLRTVFEPFLPYEGLLWILSHRLARVIGRTRSGVPGCSPSADAELEENFDVKGLGIKSFTARTMPVTGAVLLLFVIFHILDLTTGTRPIGSSEYEAATRTRSYAYDNLIASFERPLVAVFYIVAMALLAMHLAHGLWSAVNDLGVTGQRLRQIGVALSGIFALVVMVGNMSIPIAVMTGAISKTGAS